MTPPLEHDYIGIGLSSASTTTTTTTTNNNNNALKTELRLGLPGSESPERAANGLPGLTLALTPRAAAGSKRGFSDSSPKWVFGSESKPKVDDDNNKLQLQPNNNPVPAAKAQVVGWPPVRNYRKNTMANNSNTNSNPSLKKKEEEDGEGKVGSGCLYVKVSMDGAPYLRKVDLKMYSNYKDLSLALQKMFSCFTIGQWGSHGMPARDGQGESRLTDHGSENVLTYEDKDGDWMLVGDVPWDMFTETCRRLRIMKGSDAIGLAPRATGKSKTQN